MCQMYKCLFLRVIMEDTYYLLLLMCLAAVCFWYVRKLKGRCTSNHFL